MNTKSTTHLLRWFLLLWVCLVYIWGCLALANINPKAWDQPEKNIPAILPQLNSNIQVISIFTGLILLYGALLWLGLSEKIAQRFYWFYFPGQGVLVLVIGFVAQQENVVLSLYLALTLAAISMLKRAGPVTLIASGSLILFVLSSFWTIWPQQQHWTILLGILWLRSDYPALILFGVGYIVLYIQQTRSHAQLEATHTELATTYTQLELAHAQLISSAEQIETLTRANERQRLARELHDTLAQGLAGLVMQIQAANSHLAQERYPLAQEIMRQTVVSARQTLAAARSAIDDLRATTLYPENLPEALEEELRRFTATTGIPCETSGLTLLAKLPAQLGEHALRTISEGLTNVAKHAQASQVRIGVTENNRVITIEVQDNGIGFDPASIAAQTGHYGLLGLEERACLVEGCFAIISAPGRGTTVRLAMPALQNEAIVR
jgi:NarL family two-component system sensor histidine kinase YdfH